MILKTKLSLGLGFLFAIIIALVLFCSYYVKKLSNDSDNILKDNYASLIYSKYMTSSLDGIKDSINNSVFNRKENRESSDYYSKLFDVSMIEFEKNLKLENNNITEIHEKEYVESLNKNYDLLMGICKKIKKNLNNSQTYFTEFLPALSKVKESINNIYDVNLQAIERKNMTSKQDSEKILIYMAVIGTLCIILAFGYFWYFPFYVSNTVTYLSDKMVELLKKSGIKINIKTNDEAFIILQGINLLENKFGKMKKDKK
jgi:two-component system, NtrC family, sensor histidine kinase KinB